ncbi:MAG TPA: hypothetical protein VFO85_15130, partial [Vicinamibacteria bacterium]|nr:hypothetical protein [Vicinamibacteria bacterium]
WDVRLLPLRAPGAARPFATTRFAETYAAFSRDGRYVAYVSDESGRSEVYVRGYAGHEGKWPVSAAGGGEPVWSADGRELFFRNGDALFSVAVSTTGRFTAGPPRVVVRGAFEPGINGYPNYDVAPDGRRFLVIKPAVQAQAHLQLAIVPAWRAELESRLGRPGRR